MHILVWMGALSFQKDRIDDRVQKFVRKWKGSVSAEIGIGLQKRKFLSYSRSPEELGVMKTVRRALGPDNPMNPTKMFEPEQPGQ
ncbi:FAD-linked oxidase C-terminal domain-containing protein [Sulfitobacter sp. EhC04]|uniref:FAD-linked oxidase C-terminal domain-containing protein n=1 Tax=Sulfitobacter sp. EhC04 TaxID=1849168 RepID=UPI0008329EA5|nr:FAD-linked oxidase C-terminal domain-containing protein [Sulfitobacter sp. EhC04]